MPVYLFTLHAYRSWMPDRERGYVRRGEGLLESDPQMAKAYECRATQELVEFDDELQRLMIEAVLESCEHQNYRLHFVATETSHVHILVSWKSDKKWKVVRRGLRSSLTRKLNEEIEKRDWFSRGGSRKRVKDRKHFDYLVERYLPRHSGWKWNEGKGRFR